MKLTIYDIAKATGVSIATVSKVLNNKGSISLKTRQRVLNAVKSLEYEPNFIASALAGKNTNSIAIMIPDVNNPVYSEVIRGAEDVAFEKGYSLLICNTDNDDDKDKTYLWTLRNKKMDGIIIATGSSNLTIIQELLKENIRIILLGRDIPELNLPFVGHNDYMGGYLAATHLLELGHSSIGIILESLRFLPNKERLRGFEDSIKNKKVNVKVLTSNEYGVAAGSKQAHKLISKHNVTAIFTSNDLLAVGAMQACFDLGKQVPEDISIVGFDDSSLAKIVNPALTTISQPIYEIGRKAASLLIEAIETENFPLSKIVFDVNLTVRKSSGPPL